MINRKDVFMSIDSYVICQVIRKAEEKELTDAQQQNQVNVLDRSPLYKVVLSIYNKKKSTGTLGHAFMSETHIRKLTRVQYDEPVKEFKEMLIILYKDEKVINELMKELED